MRKPAAGASLLLLLTFGTILSAQQIHGDYIESRSTDVYVAQCFANGETGLTGNQALLAWHVTEGRGTASSSMVLRWLPRCVRGPRWAIPTASRIPHKRC